MSYCSHQLLDYDKAVQLYRCRDCPNLFEARMIGTNPKGETQEKQPSKLFPIICIIAGLIFGLAVLVMVYKLQLRPPDIKLAPKPVSECLDTKKWKKRAQKANLELSECLSKPPEIEYRKNPIIIEKECPDIYIPPEKVCPEVEECPKGYKAEFQECMRVRGSTLYELEQCRAASGKDDSALRACEIKTEELRGILSRMTRNQRTCPSVDVRASERGCDKEITAACGNLREALEFYFEKSKSQPGAEGDEGFANGMSGFLSPGALIDDDEDFKELDEE